MTENLQKFLEAVSKNDAMIEKVNKMNKDELLAFAKDLGITLTEEDFEKPEKELSDDELDAVAGGGDCFCAYGGGGTSDNDDDTCACVLAGLGFTKNNSDRCVFSFAGYGTNT